MTRKVKAIVVILALAAALLASGCMWGIVRDETGTGVAGAKVSYTDVSGAQGVTYTDANGLYALDIESASAPQWSATWKPLPVTGPATIQVSAPGHAPITERRNIRYDDNPNASLSAPLSFWEIQHFELTVPEDNPLVYGPWREEAQFACGTGAEVTPERPIEELLFDADHTFSVTWIPFEVYRDYWGEYSHDTTQGTLDLTVTGGNNVPTDLDGSGTFSIDSQGRLILTDMWLGSPTDEAAAAKCGHRFTSAGR